MTDEYTLPEQALNEEALAIALKLISNAEACSLIAYPDPASDLYKTMSTYNMVQKWMRGDMKWEDLPEHFQALSGHPWTIGYGHTGPDVNEHTVWTQEQATDNLKASVAKVMTECIKDCPALASMTSQCIAAITDLAYNIGNHAFATSTACSEIIAGNYQNVGADIRLYNKSHGLIVHGLDNRRKVDEAMWNSGI